MSPGRSFFGEEERVADKLYQVRPSLPLFQDDPGVVGHPEALHVIAELLQDIELDRVFTQVFFAVSREVVDAVHLDDQSFAMPYALAVEICQHYVFLNGMLLTVIDGLGAFDRLYSLEDLLLELGNSGQLALSGLLNCPI